MSNGFKEELPILATMNQLGCGRTTQGNATEHKGPGMITDLLPAFFSLLSDKSDRMELPEFVFADSRGQVARRKRRGRHLPGMSIRPDALPVQNLCDRFKRTAARYCLRMLIRHRAGMCSWRGAHAAHRLV